VTFQHNFESGAQFLGASREIINLLRVIGQAAEFGLQQHKRVGEARVGAAIDFQEAVAIVEIGATLPARKKLEKQIRPAPQFRHRGQNFRALDRFHSQGRFRVASQFLYSVVADFDAEVLRGHVFHFMASSNTSAA